MAIFKKNEEKEFEEFEEEKKLLKKEEKEDKKLGKKFKDLNPKNKKKRKEPPKPWGKKERITLLIIFLVTLLISFMLSIGSRGIKIPEIKPIDLGNINFDSLNIFGEKTIIIYKK